MLIPQALQKSSAQAQLWAWGSGSGHPCACPAGECRAGARGFCTRDEVAFQEKKYKLSLDLQEQHLVTKLSLQSYKAYVSFTVLTHLIFCYCRDGWAGAMVVGW